MVSGAESTLCHAKMLGAIPAIASDPVFAVSDSVTNGRIFSQPHFSRFYCGSRMLLIGCPRLDLIALPIEGDRAWLFAASVVLKWRRARRFAVSAVNQRAHQPQHRQSHHQSKQEELRVWRKTLQACCATRWDGSPA